MPVSLPTSTLDSIQCHSISQCNAHAAAYRCTAFRNETTAVSTGTSLLSVSPLVIGPPPIRFLSSPPPPSIKASREYGTRAVLFYRFYFSVYASLFIHRGPRVAAYSAAICCPANPAYYIIPRSVSLGRELRPSSRFFRYRATPIRCRKRARAFQINVVTRYVTDTPPVTEKWNFIGRYVNFRRTFRKSPAAISPL